MLYSSSICSIKFSSNKYFYIETGFNLSHFINKLVVFPFKIIVIKAIAPVLNKIISLVLGSILSSALIIRARVKAMAPLSPA